jgi:streptogramin lyase
MRNAAQPCIRQLLPVVLFVPSLLFCAGLWGQTVTEFALPEGVSPGEIVTGPDGNLWFTEWALEASRVGRLTVGGDVALFPSGARSGYSPVGIVAGSDGNLWLAYMDLSDFSTIIRMTPSGAHTEFPASPVGIAAGPDGNLWFTQFAGSIGRMTIAGQITYFPLPATQSEPTWDITTGPDGSLWFTFLGSPKVGRITSAGVVTVFPVPVRPRRITTGPDGSLWFTGEGNQIARITTAGAVTDFVVPGSAWNLIAGPDGTIWFLYSNEARIGRITTSGVLLDPIPIPNAAWDLTIGPDGNVWFTEPNAGKIGRIELARAPAIDSRILPVVGSTVGAINSFFRTAVQLHNPTAARISGRLVFHPSGTSGTESDPAVGYSLSPGQTQSIADFLPAMGRAGLGTADIEVTVGSVPAVTVRVFNDWGAAGTTGFTEEPMRAEDALRPEVSGVLLVPADPTRFRFNIGVRTLGTESTATLTLRGASGAVLETVSRTFLPNYHEQRSAAEFLGVSTLPAGGSIGISMSSGSAFFYGATVDNTTGDPSFQIARPAP